MSEITPHTDYAAWLSELKHRMQSAQQRVALSVIFVETLPGNLRDSLPTVEEIQTNLQQWQQQAGGAQ